MERKKTIYEGTIFTVIVILVTAHFMGQCVNGLCSEDWLIKNLIMGVIIEILSFFYLQKFISDGGLTVFQQTKNIKKLLNYYKKIRLFSIAAALYATCLMIQPYVIIKNNLKGTYLEILIILFFSLSVFTSTTKDINRIKNRRWLLLKKSRLMNLDFFNSN